MNKHTNSKFRLTFHTTLFTLPCAIYILQAYEQSQTALCDGYTKTLILDIVFVHESHTQKHESWWLVLSDTPLFLIVVVAQPSTTVVLVMTTMQPVKSSI